MIINFVKTIFSSYKGVNGVMSIKGQYILEVRAGEYAGLEEAFKLLVGLYLECHKTSAVLTDAAGSSASSGAALMLFGYMMSHSPQLLVSPDVAWDAARHFVQAVRVDVHGRKVTPGLRLV